MLQFASNSVYCCAMLHLSDSRQSAARWAPDGQLLYADTACHMSSCYMHICSMSYVQLLHAHTACQTRPVATMQHVTWAAATCSRSMLCAQLLHASAAYLVSSCCSMSHVQLPHPHTARHMSIYHMHMHIQHCTALHIQHVTCPMLAVPA